MVTSFSKLLTAFLVVSCVAVSCIDTRPFIEKTKDIAVGMTYDGVEKLLGKPAEITRGVAQLAEGSSGTQSAEGIETIGGLIYVSWLFREIKVDTNYTTVKVYKPGREGGMEERWSYEVWYHYGVIFDASSGRVVQWGFQPTLVTTPSAHTREAVNGK